MPKICYILQNALATLVSKHRWILTELKYLNMLGVVGALGFFSDALQSKMGTIFISRTSGADIGNRVSALFIGQAIMGCTSYVVVQGIAAGMSTLCSQAYGATNYKLMGTYFMRALTIASLTCFPIWTIWLSVKPILFYITRDSELAQGAGDYTTVLCFSYPAYIYSRLAFNFLQSQNIVFPNLAIQVSGNLLNICFQCIFVVVIPLSIKGVALSYVLSTYFIALLLFAYIQLTSIHLTYSMFSWSCLSDWYHFLKYGSAGVFQLLVDLIASRMVPIILIGFVLSNTNQLALLGIYNVVLFIFLTAGLGFGIGANVRIGNLLGENSWLQAKKASVVFISFVFLVELCFAILITSFSHYISFIFTSDPEFRKSIEFGFKIVSFGVISDTLYTARGICNACCLQMRAFVGQLIIMIVAVILGCVLGYSVPWQAAGYYLFLGIGFSISCLYDLLIIYFINWEKIARDISQNTNVTNLVTLPSNQVYSRNAFSRTEKIFLLSRYIIPMLIGLIVFEIAFNYLVCI